MSHLTDLSSPTEALQTAGILIVDDEPTNVRLLEQMLAVDGYQNVRGITDPRETLTSVVEQGTTLLLLDLNMPYLDGFQVLAQLRALALPPAVLVLTAQSDSPVKLRALRSGARDFLTKPIDMAELLARVRNLIEVQRHQLYLRQQNAILEEMVRERTRELHDTRLEIIHRLGRAAEYRDNETGLHIIRMSRYSQLLGQLAGMDEAETELLLHASPMHDIGKIGIPDRILLKPGRLDAEEWAIMQTHARIGADLLDGHPAPLLQMARDIALTHHEKWDGSGYPDGRVGEAIPLVGRIVAVADVFDALTSARPYKPAWPLERALDYLSEQRGRHFDPRLVDLFLGNLDAFLAIRTRYAEPDLGEVSP
ncbi:MAG: HD domain-containing phosphohydrolase [Thiobacillaceae bacterium]